MQDAHWLEMSPSRTSWLGERTVDEGSDSMKLIRMRKRGRLTIPRDLRQELGLHEGETLAIRVTADRHLDLEVLPSLTADQLCTTFPITEPIDDESWHRDMAAAMAKERSLSSGA